MNPERIVLVAAVLVSAAAFYFPVRKRYEIIRSLKGSFDASGGERRFFRFVREVLLQSKVISQRPLPGLMHAFVFWGFVGFALVSLDHFCRGGFGLPLLGHGRVHDVLRAAAAVFAVLVLLGINYLAYRRFVVRPEVLGKHLSWSSGLVALFIDLLMVSYLLDCFVFEDSSALFTGAGTAATVNWWVHALVILAFLVLIPRSKHLHLAFAPFTTYLKPFELARLKPLDFEKEEFGAEKLADLDCFTGLSAFTCVECGRCLENCPAAQTGKKLDPKGLILDLRKGLLKDIESPVAGETVDEEVLWQCTTCGSCTWQCPVGVEHVTPIIEARRGLVAGGLFPSPLKTLFKNVERYQNPWGYARDQALEFLEENRYPRFEGQEVLYWMGCLARYDDHYRKVSLAFVEKLEAAGVSFGVLYDESCTGDAVRRAGNEFVFQEIAQANIELLNKANPARIVTTCPHCMRTLEEYRDLGLSPGIEIVHHSAFLASLAAAGRLAGVRGDGAPGRAVYHDACYLSRYRSSAGSKEPRDFLGARGLSLSEPGRSRERSFCCGAGGAQFFNEETEGKRINLERVDEILSLEPGVIVTACPFCQAMLRDGLADRGVEDVEVKDLAQM